MSDQNQIMKTVITAANITKKLTSSDDTIQADIDQMLELIESGITPDVTTVNAMEQAITVRIEVGTPEQHAFLEKYIDQFTFIDNIYMGARLKLRSLMDGAADREKIAALMEENIECRRPENQFAYLQAVANMAIGTSDVELIEAAVERIQQLT